MCEIIFQALLQFQGSAVRVWRQMDLDVRTSNCTVFPALIPPGANGDATGVAGQQWSYENIWAVDISRMGQLCNDCHDSFVSLSLGREHCNIKLAPCFSFCPDLGCRVASQLGVCDGHFFAPLTSCNYLLDLLDYPFSEIWFHPSCEVPC